jgi:hypothetical protein
MLIALLILNALCIPLGVYNIKTATDETFLDSHAWAWFCLGLNILAVIVLAIALL